jgi:hypothetical protein
MCVKRGVMDVQIGKKLDGLPHILDFVEADLKD